MIKLEIQENNNYIYNIVNINFNCDFNKKQL